MGGYGFYVWGSYLFALVAIGWELLSLRQRKDSGEKLTPRERNLAYVARKAYRSFRFGTARG